MPDKSNNPVSANYFLKPGYILIPTKPTVISTVLGSCVSVCIYDRKRNTGGMNHFQFPYIRKKYEATARYGNVAVSALLRMLIDDGSKQEDLEAQIFGGACNSVISSEDIGYENIKIARKILAKRVPVVSEDVGGKKGRKIVFYADTNEIAVFKVDRLRKGDWYPYLNDR